MLFLSLFAFYLATDFTSGADNSRLRSAIPAYVTVVVEDEWPRLAWQQRSATTDAALEVLLREVAQTGASKDADARKALLDMVLRIRNAHEDRIEISNDRTAVSKWASVLYLPPWGVATKASPRARERYLCKFSGENGSYF